MAYAEYSKQYNESAAEFGEIHGDFVLSKEYSKKKNEEEGKARREGLQGRRNSVAITGHTIPHEVRHADALREFEAQKNYDDFEGEGDTARIVQKEWIRRYGKPYTAERIEMPEGKFKNEKDDNDEAPRLGQRPLPPPRAPPKDDLIDSRLDQRRESMASNTSDGGRYEIPERYQPEFGDRHKAALEEFNRRTYHELGHSEVVAREFYLRKGKEQAALGLAPGGYRGDPPNPGVLMCRRQRSSPGSV